MMNQSLNQILEIVANDHFQGVNARNLHQALKVGRDFSNWIKSRLHGQISLRSRISLLFKIPPLARQNWRAKKVIIFCPTKLASKKKLEADIIAMTTF
ncbi:Phage anti-repressor protein [Mannheimia haemolytica]|uniref:Phage anti-repressor protein n=1 Tax=Mannheimia haemolytica TaxID=75985 RepID=A0A378MUN7_MANHA|nr:Phage anti-repressor protein [Mannheimia haemolytica]